MTRRVLGLYEMGNFSMLSDLQKALQCKVPVTAPSTLMSSDFYGQINSFCQSHRHSSNAPYVFYFLSVSPASAGSG
jgi:hypothetical protein